jgi:L-methionine (R)-S-oxide reductase
MPGHEELLHEFHELAITAASAESLMQRMSDRLHQEVPRYNWVGFYLVDKNDPSFLVVGPHTGSFTPNVRIPFDRGLCGAAASTGKTVVVDDVKKDARYMAGSDLVKSEIVVPIFAHRKLVAELDVESYFSGSFTALEQKFVETCAALVARYFEKNPQQK